MYMPAKRNQVFILASLLILLSLISFAAPVLAVDGRALFASCTACHGAQGEGNASLGTPNIARMPAWYVAKQLGNFASGKRGADKVDRYGTQMREAAKVLVAEDQRLSVAQYIATLPPQPVTPSGKISPVELANGRSQFNAICSSCHGSTARGNPTLGAPSLIGLDATYAERQLRAFRDGQRGAHPDDKWGAQMRVGASMLPDLKSGRDALAYIATLK